MKIYTIALTSLLCYSLLVLINQVAAGEIDFRRDIRPLLSDRCMSCHGPDDEHRESDLRFDREESVKQDRGGYAVIDVVSPAKSEMLARILSDDPDLVMPPPHGPKPLDAQQIELIKTWIEQGAEWSEHWAYEPPVLSAVPVVKQADWPENSIDHFLLHRLEQSGVEPAPLADRITLLRRLCFDLTGLPPTPAQVDQFVQDDSSSALEKQIDRLLAAPNFGERMAVYWLDLVRYADTVGYHGDQDHNISPYRDWVIDAFNSNMRFDEFTRQQLAGDLMAGGNIDYKIASGYNRLLQTSHEGGLQPKEYLAIYAADRVRNVSAVWMGATVGCAQCHSHKYDPYTIKDFYTLAAFFADLDEAQHFKVGGNTLPTNRPPEIYVLSPQERTDFQSLTDELKKLQDELEQVFAGDIAYRAGLDQEIETLQQKLTQLRQQRRKTMISAAIDPREVRVLPRGNWMDDSGPVVSPAFPEFLAPTVEETTRQTQRLTRLELANWLVDTRQGSGLLTARVMVNRFWYLMFGQGLADLTDFGGQGRPPSHPELLDWLAWEYVNSNWDTKHLLKLMAMSQAYRMSSIPTAPQLAKDPENVLFCRQNRYRLSAESIRDNALAISGLLIDEQGGPSSRPYQPAGYYRHLNFPQREYVSHSDANQWRRGVYVHWQRMFLHPMLKAFDAPSREECTAERPRSNTPLAALTLLNDPTFVEAARVFAVRILNEGGDDFESRINYASQLAVSRILEPEEKALFEQTLKENSLVYEQNPEAIQQLLSVGQAPLPEKMDRNEVASWTQVCRVLLNLNETMTRN